jgi:hypothetical protein
MTRTGSTGIEVKKYMKIERSSNPNPAPPKPPTKRLFLKLSNFATKSASGIAVI